MQASTLITPRLAEEAINSRLTCLPIESLPLTQCVGGTLRENIYAERDQPPFDRVTMDGIAVDSESLRRGRAPLSHPGDSGRGLAGAEAVPGRRRDRGDDGRHPAARAATASSRSSSTKSPMASQSLKSTVVSTPVPQRPPPRQRRPPGCAAAANRYVAARPGNRGRGFRRHGARAGEQPTGNHDRLDRR